MTPADEREQQEKGFVVIDRRGQESEAAAPTAPAAEQPAASPRPLPGVDFASLAISLGTSALYHLGLIADPETGRPGERNLELARQTIDVLEMLQVKTRGNLDPEEQDLLQRLLTDLRMRFVEARKG